jgi:hypothetical protein
MGKQTNDLETTNLKGENQMSEVSHEKNKSEETKKCKYCQSDIPKKAKVCPNCRKKQKGKGGIIALIIVILIVIIACSSGNKDTASVDNKNTDNKVSDAETDTTQSEEEISGNIVGLGESFEANGLKVTVDDVNTEYQVKDDEYNLYKLDEGLKYVAVSFTFENTGDTDAYVSIYDFDCYADNTACEQQYLPDGGDFVNTNLSSGRNISFTTYYAVPTDAKTVELEYTSNVWTDEKVIISVQ